MARLWAADRVMAQGEIPAFFIISQAGIFTPVEVILLREIFTHKTSPGFLAGQAACADYFITLDPAADTSSVLRPRTSPLLHPFDTPHGRRWCWTTFSADQVDLNFKNPQVLLEILDVLLTYVRRGARIVRLDAIAYV